MSECITPLCLRTLSTFCRRKKYFYCSIDAPLLLSTLPCQRIRDTMDEPRRMNIDCSLKNIPIPPDDVYRKDLLAKVESVVRRMRWKAFFLLNGQGGSNAPDNCFGFKSRNSPPHVAEMKAFEDDLVKMMENVKFRRVNGPFQNDLREKAGPFQNPTKSLSRPTKPATCTRYRASGTTSY